MRRLLAEGGLTTTILPTLIRHMRRGDDTAMWRFVASISYLMTLVLTATTVLGIVAAPLLMRGLAWGFAADPAKFALTVGLSRWLFPYILLVSLSALASGILNAFDRFALPAFTPVLMNLSVIGCALAFAGRFREPAWAFTIGVLVGGVLQLAVQIPPLLRRGLNLRLPFRPDYDAVREVGRSFLPRLFGVGITQFNLVVDSQFASALGTGRVSILYYAIRVTELTLGVFAFSLTTAVLPRLSRAAADGDRDAVLGTLGTATRLLVFLMLPATVGLIVLRLPIIHTLFERGRFSPHDTLDTADALACYAIGLLPFAAINVLAIVFFAYRDSRTPVVAGAISFALHLVLILALRGPLEQRGIALSTSLSALVNAAFLGRQITRRYGAFLDRRVAVSMLRSCGAAAVMALSLSAAVAWIDVTSIHGTAAKGAVLGSMIVAGALLYFITAYVLRSEEIDLLKASFVSSAEDR